MKGGLSHWMSLEFVCLVIGCWGIVVPCGLVVKDWQDWGTGGTCDFVCGLIALLIDFLQQGLSWLVYPDASSLFPGWQNQAGNSLAAVSSTDFWSPW